MVELPLATTMMQNLCDTSLEMEDGTNVESPYRPLKHETSTRLVLLHPGLQGEMIKCSLVEVDLRDDPEYDAVSYAWGAAEEQEEIIVNKTPRQIYPNLAGCLHKLQSETVE